LLSDFGAAAFVPAGATAEALERIEVRAFGCLLDELLARCGPGAPAAWTALRDRCLHAHVAGRPSFADLVDALAP
jgi:hypothetical protein